MQTISKVAERLDMSAEDAVARLRDLMFEVDGVDTTITDEQFDILVDIDDDPTVADQYLQDRLAEKEKAEKAQAKKKKAAAKKKKAAAKKKPAKKKAAAKKKSAPAKKKAASADAGDIADADAEPAGEILEPVVAEILPEAGEVKEPKAAEILPEKEEPKGPAIVIGTAIEHDTHTAEIIRADGTHQDASEVEIDEAEAAAVEEGGLLAQAERAAARKKDTPAATPEDAIDGDDSRPLPTPDPDVVAEVIRKAGETQATKEKKKQTTKGRPKTKEEQQDWQEEVKKTTRFAGAVQVPTHRPSQSNRRTGKTARKRMQKVERQRRDEELRRQAAANVKEYQSGALDGGTKKKRKKSADDEGFVKPSRQVVQVEDTLTVEQLADAMDVDTNELILELMDHSVMATKNQSLSMELIRELAAARDFEVEAVIPEEEDVMAEEPDNPEDLLPRAPVVTVMGHVDHGKTSLLDQVRKASVAAGEAGGITQHIAAYEVEMPQGRIVFLDTPGHEAFTALRARGAQVTDVVVLVVAADDGIMPQTKEAIDHARAAEVPIVVAINKCDKPDAQPDRIRQELVQFDLVDEQWGGKTIIKNISALSGEGIDELMELLVLETELLELNGNAKKRVRGAIIESEIARGLGPVAWVLVQSGTLKVGDVFLAGESYGRVRSIQNSRGESITEAGPATPVVVTGFNTPPDAGDIFVCLDEERVARSVAEKRSHRSKLKDGAVTRHVTLEDFHARLLAGEKAELNVIVKADVQGSVDVLESSLPKVGNEEAQAKILHAGVGQINESDVLLASVTDAVILGFHVGASSKAEKMAQTEGVDIHTYEVIYELLEEVRKSLEGMLTPDLQEVVVGHAEIRAIFKSSAIGKIAGCMMLDGEIRRDSKIRVQRGGEVVFEGLLDSLRREKDSVAQVQQGFECGIKVANFDDIREGDVIEAYKVEEVAKTLA